MFINLTPHAINIYDSATVKYNSVSRCYNPLPNAAPIITLPSQGAARCTMQESIVDNACIAEGIEVPVVTNSYGEITGLPDSKPGVFYIVSLVVAQAAKSLGRADCYIPSRMVRNDQGQPIGCCALARV